MGLLENCRRFEFGACSLQTLPPLPSTDQKTLHSSQATLIHFTTTVDDTLCDVSFTFTPFRRLCNLTYHEYEIHCSIPHGTPHEGLRRRSIIDIAQRLYDIHFSKNAGYRLELLETELQISSPRTGKKRRVPGGGEAVHSQASGVPTNHVSTSNLQGAPESHHFIAWKPEEPEEPLPKHRIFNGASSHGTEPKAFSFVAWKPDVSIQDVRESYERAKLQFPSLPQLADSSDYALIPTVAGSRQTGSWNPFILSKWLLRHALLDEERLEVLQKQLSLVKQKVPNNAHWIMRTEELGLTPTDLRSLLWTAFSPTHTPKLFGPGSTQSDSSSGPSEMPASGKMPHILGMALSVLQLGNDFEALQTTYQRAMAITRIVAYALMRVSEVAGEVTPHRLIDSMKTYSKGNDDWQKKSRNLACSWCWAMTQLPRLKGGELAMYLMLVEGSGEKILRNLFQPALPAAAGEFVSLLSSEEYSQDLRSANIPGVVEIVKVLLRGYVSDVIICRALGCPDSYLDGDSSAADFLTECSFVRDSSSNRRTEESTAFMDMDADPDETFRYIYSGGYEDIETLLSRGYDFATSAQS